MKLKYLYIWKIIIAGRRATEERVYSDNLAVLRIKSIFENILSTVVLFYASMSTGAQDK